MSAIPKIVASDITVLRSAAVMRRSRLPADDESLAALLTVFVCFVLAREARLVVHP